MTRRRTRVAGTWRITTAPRRTADEYGILFSALFCERALPDRDVDRDRRLERRAADRPRAARGLREILRRASRRSSPRRKQTLIPIRTDRPTRTRQPTWSPRAIARARTLRRAARSSINFGTATTYGAVDADGAYRRRRDRAGHPDLDRRAGRADGEAAAGRARSAGASRSGATRSPRFSPASCSASSARPKRSSRASAPNSGADARVVATGGLAEIVARQTRGDRRGRAAPRAGRAAPLPRAQRRP